MKKFIRTIFVLVLSLVTVALAACDEKLEFTAEDVIKVLLVEQETYVTDDFVVPGVIKHKDVVYNLQWASDNNCLAVAAEMDANNNYKISVTRPDEYQAANLTATLVIGKTTATKKFEFSVYPVDVYELSEAYRFVYNNKTVSESFDLDATFALHGKTASITWSIPEAEAGKYTIEEGKVKFDPVSKNIPTTIKAVFSYGGMETPMTYKFTMVPPTTVQNPKDGDTFKLALYQSNLGKNLYFTGKTSGHYLATSDKAEEGVDVTVHEVTGGYTLSFVIDGATKYVDITESGDYVNASIVDEPTSPLQFNKEYYTFIKYIESKKTDYYIGTYGTYNTISASTISYAATSFPCVLTDISKMPAAPEVQLPALETTFTTTPFAELNAMAPNSNDTTSEKYYAIGYVVAVANEKYGNMTLKDAEGNTLNVYGAYSFDGELRYDALSLGLKADDVVVLYGVMNNFNGTVQMKNAWIMQVGTKVLTADDAYKALYTGSKELTAPETAEADFELKLVGTKYTDATVVWTSNNAAITVNGANAVVTRPAAGEADVTVKLTAVVTVGEKTFTKEVSVVVKAIPSEEEGGEGTTPDPITYTINNAMPTGLSYITNNSNYPNPKYYTNGGLKVNYEKMGVQTAQFAAANKVVVTIDIKALNPNEKTYASSTDIITVYGLDASGATVATGTLTSVAAGTGNVVTLEGTGIVAVKVIMTGYPKVGTTYQNINLGGLTVSFE